MAAMEVDIATRLGGLKATPFTNYKEHNIKDDKMANMVTMYDKFIPPDRRPEYLPALKQSLSILCMT